VPEETFGDGVTRLRLPGNRTTTLRGDPVDVSVFRAVSSSGGEWEPHVRAWMEANVQPDWVCMDVGANIGTHTLTLAVLGQAGRVIAIEAGPQNFAFLKSNVAALAKPHGEVELHWAAAWDAPGPLQLAFPAALQGCGFISDKEAEEGGRLLRAANPNALPGETLRVTMETVEAVRLDELTGHLSRLDLIKLDVEGAEARVLAGAAETLRRFNPVLLTEYNPSCAVYMNADPSGYFGVLLGLFRTIQIIESDGSLSQPLTSWAEMDERLKACSGWKDLVCSNP
jgi:FkbM family methyltransferase